MSLKNLPKKTITSPFTVAPINLNSAENIKKKRNKPLQHPGYNIIIFFPYEVFNNKSYKIGGQYKARLKTYNYQRDLCTAKAAV